MTRTRARFRSRVGFGLAALGLCALVSGCASPRMKGTPFYTGEYRVRTGAPTERVNLWPLVYYRAPTLSVLWPFIEHSDELAAVRPFYSVYGLDRPERIYSVLWPLSEFDQERQRNRIFPVFWGKRYMVGFPLYWRWSDPEDGWDALLPLWAKRWDASGTSLDVLWPLVNVERRQYSRGWRAWPLAGSYGSGAGDRYRFLLWPLGHQWSDPAKGSRGSMLLPLFASGRTRQGSYFLSLPYSTGTVGARTWRAVPPLFWSQDDGRVSTLLTPLYARGVDRVRSNSWNLLLPLALRQTSPSGSFLATPLGGYSRRERSECWMVGPGLVFGGSDSNGNRWWWAGGVVAHSRHTASVSEQHVVPLFYRRADQSGETFLSVPYSYRRRATGGGWNLIPPVLFRQSQSGDSALVSPLYCAGGTAAGSNRWSAVFPLYYRRDTPDGRRLATLLGGYEEDRAGHRWAIYPLLSGGTRSADGGSLWLAAPLVHIGHRNGVYSHHVLPLYMWEGERRRLYSLLAANWQDARGDATTLVPPLLSWYRESPQRRDMWLAGGLARWSGGSARGASYVFPVYFRGKDWLLTPVYLRGRDWWITPLLGHGSDGMAERWICPPLLGAYRDTGARKTATGLAGLVRHEWGGGGRASGWLLPLYWFDGPSSVYTLPLGWHRDGTQNMTYALAGLAGVRSGRREGGWLWPLYGRERDRDSGSTAGFMLWGRFRSGGSTSESHLLPFYRYVNNGEAPKAPGLAARDTYGRKFWSLPACWYEDTVRVRTSQQSMGYESRRRHGVFPLWSYCAVGQADGGRHSEFRVLGLLYDAIETTPPPASGGTPAESVRKRILWRLWHYQRTGQDVSIDVFPAVTYDRTAAGRHGFSFLWRLIRYEAGPDGVKCDLLYLPVKR